MNMHDLDTAAGPWRLKHRMIELAVRYGLAHSEIWGAWHRLLRYGAISWSSENVLRIDYTNQTHADEIGELLVLVEQMALKRSMKYSNKNWQYLVVLASRTFSAFLNAQGGLCSTSSIDFQTQHKLIHHAAISNCRSTALISAHSLLMDAIARFQMRGEPIALDIASIRNDHMHLVQRILMDDPRGVLSWSERHFA